MQSAETKSNISYQFLYRRHFEGYEGEEDQYVVVAIEQGGGKKFPFQNLRDGSFTRQEKDRIERFKGIILGKGNPEYQRLFSFTAKEMFKLNLFRAIARARSAEFNVMDECEILSSEVAVNRSRGYFENDADVDRWFRDVVKR